MSQDSAAVPATQLELEGEDNGAYFCSSQPPSEDYVIMPTQSPPAHDHCEQEEDDDDPPSHSSTPSLDLVELAEISNPHLSAAPQQQQAWATYAGMPFDAGTGIITQLSGFVIADRFRLRRIVGHGSFGCTYKALDILHGDAEVAVKVAKGRHAHDAIAFYKYDDFLQVEYNAYQHLLAADVGPSTGIPGILAAGIQKFAPDAANDDRPVFTVSFLAMELLGPTCWEASNALRLHYDSTAAGTDSDDEAASSSQRSAREPSTPWIVKTGKGMLQALADVHRRGFIHRDVKTENFCLAPDFTNEVIKVIDFGFARLGYGYYSFRHDYSKRCASFWGTPNYASLSALMSYPQTPRDDLECLVYCLFEMEHPTLRLPWNRDLTTNEEAKDGWSMRQLERMSKKKEAAWKAACKRGEVPDYLIGYFDYITSLGPLDIPDYEWCMMQLDSGATGVAPARSPIRRQLADWPSRGEVYSRKDYALYALSQIAAAASKILPSSSRQYSAGANASGATPRKRTLADSEEEQHDSQKRFRGLAWPEGELSDDVKPSSAITSAGSPTGASPSIAGLGEELLQLPAKASPGGFKQLRRSHRLMAAAQLVGESQEE